MGRRARPWYRESDGWWYSTVRGRQVRLANGKGSKAEAYHRFHELMAAPQGSGAAGAVSLVALGEAYLDAHQAAVAAETYATSRKYIGLFLASAGDTMAARDVRPEDVARWLGATGWAPATRRLAVSAVKALFAWGVRAGLLERDPLAGLKRPRSVPGRKAMQAPTFEAILGAVRGEVRGKPFRDFLTVMHETGCRPSEAMRLAAAHLDLAAGTATMESKTTRRTGRPRVIHLTARAIEVCRPLAARYPNGPILRTSTGTPWTRDSLSSRFYRMRRKLGLPAGTCAETIRHGWITDALVAGVPIATVAALAGHVDTAMVARVYSKLHERPEHLKEELGKVRPGGQSTK